MKITLLGHTVPYSGVTGVSRGISKYIYNLGQGLVNDGNDVRLYVRDDGFHARENWVKKIPAPTFSWIPYPIFALPKILMTKSDIFHSDWITTGYPLVVARKKHVVVSAHDVIPFTYDWKNLSPGDKIRTMWYMKCFNAIKNANAIIFMSEYARSEAKKYTDLKDDQMFVVHNGIDHSAFFPVKKQKHKKLRIGYFGGLDGRKNVTLLVESFKILNKIYDNLELHVGGTGKNLETFRKMKIPNAHFYGYIPDSKLNEFCNSLDIFVFPSLQEGFGFMLLEAMSCGVPTVAVNSGSSQEIAGKNSLMVQPIIESMVKGISKLIESEKLRDKLAVGGLDRSNEFTWEKCTNDTLNIYERIIE